MQLACCWHAVPSWHESWAWRPTEQLLRQVLLSITARADGPLLRLCQLLQLAPRVACNVWQGVP
jgi:hypothetical protein